MKRVFNLLVVDESGSMGIDNHLRFQEDEAGTREMFAQENRARERYNKCRAMDCPIETGSYFREK